MNIEVKIQATELADAIKELASAIKLTANAQPRVEGGEIVIPAGTPLTVTEVTPAEPEIPKRTRKKAAEAPQEAPTQPEQPEAVQVAPAAEPPAETPYETVAEHPAFAEIAKEAGAAPTMEQIANAGAKLLDDDPNKMPALLALLGDFNVQAITYLREDQLAAFAEKLRALGAEV